jgi:peroxiredoxin
LRDQHATAHTLSSYAGSKSVVLVFFPFAFTGVCTSELRAVQSELAALQNDDTQVLAVSCDSVASLRTFADGEGLDFPLLSDFWPHGKVASSYGVFVDELGCAARGTFVIDRAGVVRWSVRTAMGEPRDVTAYLKALAEL